MAARVILRQKRCRWYVNPCAGCIFAKENEDSCGIDSRVEDKSDPLYCGEQGDKSRLIWVLSHKL